MKDKNQIIFKTGAKNKKITKKKLVFNKRQNYQLNTSTSIIYDSQMQEVVSEPLTTRQYKQQLSFINKYMTQVFDSYNFSNSKINQLTSSFQKCLQYSPISIDKLFDNQQANIFNGSFIFNDLYDYLKLVNNQFQNKRKKIILQKRNDTLLLSEEYNRRQDNLEFKGRFISLLQSQVIQNHENFMEKIKFNQSKYQQSNSQLSDISQELLFLSRIYIENSSKIKKLGDQVALKMSSFFPQPQLQAEKLYYEVLMKKNIQYALKDNQIDFLNYFRLKQLQERNYNDISMNIQDQNSFLAYLKNKKPKKGKFSKSGLPTVCSFCFSGYFQSFNPLISCQNCNLRCHKMCWNLKQKPCGNCSYQRILKSQKQIIQYCIICKQKGEIVIKLRNKLYVHGFCLLMHNMWKVQNKKLFTLNQNKIQNAIQSYYKNINIFNQKIGLNKQNKKQIEIVYGQNLLFSIQQKDPNHQNCQMIEQEESQQNLQLNEMVLNNCKSQNSNCKICSKQFYKDLYINCIKCNSKCHIFCAFFEGCDLKHFENKLIKQNSNKVNILFDCCSKSIQEKEKLKKKRQYVLNKNRYLFQNI